MPNSMVSLLQQESLRHGGKLRFETPDDGFTARSVIVIATPTPAYSKVEFEWQGKRHPATSVALSEMDGEHAFTVTRRYLENVLSPMGYRIQSAPNLPLKRLAVRSGLAVYGRNNICYTDGMGSFFTLTAYYTDLPCMEEKDFHEFDPVLQKKVEVLGMTQWLPAIPRNLRILFELESSTHG